MSGPVTAPVEAVIIAEDSYRRCQGEAFFRAFYARLLASDPRIPPKFARTDLTKQAKLLQHSIGLLFIYAKRANPALLDRIAVRHTHSNVDVPPEMYPCFVDSLVATVREFDPQCAPAVEEAWRKAVAPGIAYMAGRYGESPRRESGS